MLWDSSSLNLVNYTAINKHNLFAFFKTCEGNGKGSSSLIMYQRCHSRDRAIQNVIFSFLFVSISAIGPILIFVSKFYVHGPAHSAILHVFTDRSESLISFAISIATGAAGSLLCFLTPSTSLCLKALHANRVQADLHSFQPGIHTRKTIGMS